MPRNAIFVEQRESQSLIRNVDAICTFPKIGILYGGNIQQFINTGDQFMAFETLSKEGNGYVVVV